MCDSVGALRCSRGARVEAGYVAPLPGQDDAAPRLVMFANNNRGELEQAGGISAYLTESAERPTSGYVLYPGEAAKKERVDPLHHYAGIDGGGFMGNTMGLDRKDEKLYRDEGLAHVRSQGPKIRGGRLGTGGDRDVPEQAVKREISLIELAKERAIRERVEAL